jgi:hydrocephalus-inducing protein
VTADPTSITLFSHQYYKIVNKSAVPIEFSWRAFATEMEENEKKERLNAQLQIEEQDEHSDIERKFHSGNLSDDDDDGSLDSDDSYSNTELEAKNERRKQKAASALSRKYQAIKKAVTED